MDQSAIKQIQETANFEKIFDQIPTNELTTPVIALPSGMMTEDLERYMPFASRLRLSLTTNHLEDYIRYCTDKSQEGTICFINAPEMKATTIFDIGNKDEPGHQSHKFTLAMKKTAVFESLLKIASTHQPQKEAAEFLEESTDFICEEKNQSGDSLSVSEAIQSIRSLTIEAAREIQSSVGDFSETASTMERIEAKGKDKILASFSFNCEPTRD